MREALDALVIKYMHVPFFTARLLRSLRSFILKHSLGIFLWNIFLTLDAIKRMDDLLKMPVEIYVICRNAYSTVAPAVERIADQYVDSQILASRLYETSQLSFCEGASVVTAGTNIIV